MHESEMEDMVAARFEDLFESLNPRNQMAMVARVREIFGELPAIPESQGQWLGRCAMAAAQVGHELLDRLEQLQDRDPGNVLRNQINKALSKGSENMAIEALDLRKAMSVLAQENHELYKLLCLKFWMGSTYDEMAAEMGLTVGTVRQRLKHAFAFLRQQLEVS